MVRKGPNRDKLTPQLTVSYKFSDKFEPVPPRRKASPPIPKKGRVTDPDLDTVEPNQGTAPSMENAPNPPGGNKPTGGESEPNPKTPSKMSEPSTSPNHNSLSMSELRNERVPKSLSEEFTDASFEHLLAKSKAFENFFQMKMDQYMAAKDEEYERKRGRRDEDPGKETLLSSSSSSKPKDEGHLLIVAVSAKEAAAITLNSLDSAAVEAWGNRVVDFEKKYPSIQWDRNTIPRNVRDLINVRWNQPVYNVHLPPALVTSIESEGGFADDQAKPPHHIHRGTFQVSSKILLDGEETHGFQDRV
jgi:hypothetical protein